MQAAAAHRLWTALHRVANALLSNAFNGWAGAAVNKRMARYRLKRFTARWLTAALSSAFNGWADAAANKRSARYRFKKVTARWRQGLKLVHYSAQLEPFPTQKHTLNTPTIP